MQDDSHFRIYACAIDTYLSTFRLCGIKRSDKPLYEKRFFTVKKELRLSFFLNRTLVVYQERYDSITYVNLHARRKTEEVLVFAIYFRKKQKNKIGIFTKIIAIFTWLFDFQGVYIYYRIIKA